MLGRKVMERINGSRNHPCFELHRTLGVFYRDCEGTEIRVCDPVEVIAFVSNPEGTQWGKIIEFTNARNQKKNLAVPMKLMMNTARSLAAELSLRGLQLPCSMQCMRLLREYLNSHYPKKHLVIDYRFLWNHAFFVSTKNDVLIPEDFIRFKTKNANNSDDEIVEKLESFISKNRDFFQSLNRQHDRPFLQILGYKSTENNRKHYYIPQQIFENEITNDTDEIYKLIEKGLLIPNTNISACHVVSINGKMCKVYVVRNLK
jgi:hypothetical protein